MRLDGGWHVLRALNSTHRQWGGSKRGFCREKRGMRCLVHQLTVIELAIGVSSRPAGERTICLSGGEYRRPCVVFDVDLKCSDMK